MTERTTWMRELTRTMSEDGDAGPVLSYAPDEASFAVEFNPGYGGEEGTPVLAWTETRVYFPICYDGAEWMGSAPRNPQPEGQPHLGGG